MKKRWLAFLGGLLVMFFLAACGVDDVYESDVYEDDAYEDQAGEIVINAGDSEPAAMFAEYTRFIKDTMEQDQVPGVAAVVVVGDEAVFLEGFGMRDIETGAPVTPDTLFHIGSNNKSMTAMMIASLVDDGVLAWDTSVVDIYPDFRLSDPELTKEVTIRHLLNMTSGIPDWAEDDFDVDNATPEDIFTYIQEVSLLGAPGEEFSYSNISASLAGYLGVLAAGGEFGDLYNGYAALLDARVLKPIGMETAVVRASDAVKNSDYGKSYILGSDGSPQEAEPEDFDGDPLAPSGAVKASAREMALYISTQLNAGLAPNGIQVVSKENMAEMWEPYLEDYGLGWEITMFEDIKVVTHEGSFDNYLSVMGFAPELDMGYVILTNCEEAAGNLIEEAPGFLIELFLQNRG